MKQAHRGLHALGAGAAVAGLSACTSLSGLNGSTDYACKAPEGVSCQSVAGTYINAVADNLPSQRGGQRPAPAPAAPAPTANPVSTALRSPSRILRLWFKPWEDADRDLFDQGYVYVQVDGGRWLVEHAQRAIREAHAPLRAVVGPEPVAPAPSPPTPAAQPPFPARPATLPAPRTSPRE